MTEPVAFEPRKETPSAVECIGAFAARPEHLKPQIRQLFKRNILDSLGCAIASLSAEPFPALGDFTSPDCRLHIPSTTYAAWRAIVVDLSEYILEPLTAQPIVFVVHNDTSIRESLESLIRCGGWQSETFAFAREFLAPPRPLVPNCLVLDVSLRDLNGLDLQRRVVVERPDTPVIFVTGHGDVPTSVQAMKAGAIEFLMNPFRDEVLLSAIREGLKRSSIALNREAGMRSLRDRYASLSYRERQVMVLVVSGLLNKQAGTELAISEITVKAHRGHVMRKMKAESFADLVRMAARLRSELALLTPGPFRSPSSSERTCGVISIDCRQGGAVAVGQRWDGL